MIIYQAQKFEFLHDVHHRDIEDVILEAFRARTGHNIMHGSKEVSQPSCHAWSYAYQAWS